MRFLRCVHNMQRLRDPEICQATRTKTEGEKKRRRERKRMAGEHKGNFYIRNDAGYDSWSYCYCFCSQKRNTTREEKHRKFSLILLQLEYIYYTSPSPFVVYRCNTGLHVHAMRFGSAIRCRWADGETANDFMQTARCNFYSIVVIVVVCCECSCGTDDER